MRLRFLSHRSMLACACLCAAPQAAPATLPPDVWGVGPLSRPLAEPELPWPCALPRCRPSLACPNNAPPALAAQPSCLPALPLPPVSPPGRRTTPPSSASAPTSSSKSRSAWWRRCAVSAALLQPLLASLCCCGEHVAGSSCRGGRPGSGGLHRSSPACCGPSHPAHTHTLTTPHLLTSNHTSNQTPPPPPPPGRHPLPPDAPG